MATVCIRETGTEADPGFLGTVLGPPFLSANGMCLLIPWDSSQWSFKDTTTRDKGKKAET